jgi:hypothetical protein
VGAAIGHGHHQGALKARRFFAYGEAGHAVPAARPLCQSVESPTDAGDPEVREVVKPGD